MSSASDSDSNASGSRSASPAASQNSGRSRSASPADNASAGSRSRSQSPESNKSERSAASSGRSRQSRSRSRSNESNRSGGSNASHRSAGSRQSAVSNRSGGSRRSNRSSSNRSTPVKPPQSPAGSAKSGSTNRSRSRSSSPGGGDKNSEAGSNKSSRSNSRSRSRSRSRSGTASPGVDSKRKTDSDDEKEKKRSKSGESDAEEDGGGEDKEVSAAAIFGDDADDISSEEEKEKEQQEEPQQDEEKEVRSDQEHENEEDTEMRQDDGDNEPETIPETRIDVQIPKISCDLGRDIHFVKLPNFLSVETRPFDPETYEDEIDEEETLDEEGRARLKLKVENTIRWRELMDKEGNIKKQSNARLVRWSDGSYSLHLGSEIFDVYKQPLQGDHNHLFIRQGTGLQGQAVFRTKLSFRPHSTESFTHRKMTLSLADRSQKIAGIKILSQVGADPDHDRKTLLKKEEEKLRQIVRASKPRKKGDTATRLHMNSSTYREDEGSDEDGAISLNAIKNKYKSGAAAKGGAIYSSDEEGSDIEARRARKLDKALKDSESSAESE